MEGVRGTMERAREICVIVDRDFRRMGWTLSLFGSVLKIGSGRDIDLVASNWREEPDIQGALSVLRVHLGFTETAHRESLFCYAVEGKITSGEILEIQFRAQPLREFAKCVPFLAE